MKKTQTKLLKACAKLSKATAVKACGSASLFLCYQPKEPAMLKKASKR